MTATVAFDGWAMFTLAAAFVMMFVWLAVACHRAPLVCDYCGKILADEDDRRWHVALHHGGKV